MNIELIKKIRNPVLIITGVISAYALVGFVVLPKLIESQLPKIIETETGRKATLERMEFNPFTLKLSLKGFSMQEKDLQTFVSFDEFFVDVQVWESIREFALVLSDIRLSKPYVRLEELKDNQFNFSDLSTESTEEEEDVVENEDEGVFPLIIHQLTIAQGTFKGVDATYNEPVESLVNDIDLHLEAFSTLPDKDATLGFSLGLNSGGVLRWQGDFGVNPVFSNGKIEIEGLKFARIWALFLQNKVNFQWIDGTQLIKFDYALSYADDHFSFSLSDGKWLTENLKFTEVGGQQALIDIPYFAIEGIDFDLQKQSIMIAKIASKGAAFDTSLDTTGQLNYQALFAMHEPQSRVGEDDEVPEPSADKATQPWDLNIQQIALNNSTINFRDNSHKEPVVAQVGTLDLDVNHTHLVAGELLDVDIQEIVLNSSKINFSDSNVAQPLTVGVGMLSLDVQSSRLSSGALLDVNVQGIAFKSANISLSDKGHEEPVLVDIGGVDLGLKNYHLTTGDALQMLANQGYLDVQKLDLKTKPNESLVNVPHVNMAGLDLNFKEKK